MALPAEMVCLMKETEEEGYSLVTQPVPTPGPGDVIIKVDRVGICGSDINLWKWNFLAQMIATPPFIPGHEATGKVVMVGTGVNGVKVGQRVAVENHFYCGECYQCKEGRGDICQRMSQYGVGKATMHGGCGQYSLVPARYCYPVTAPLTADQAVVLEPMGVAHNAVKSISVAGEDVLVLGCGPVGLFAIAIAKVLGARAVYGVDKVADKLDLARKMGASQVINTGKEDVAEAVRSLTGGNGVGRIVEASGAASLFNASFAWLRKGGQIALIGMIMAPLHVEDVVKDVLQKSLTLKTFHGRRIFHTWEECERLLAEGKVDISPVVSHHLPMSQYQYAFDLLTSGNASKILLDPDN